MMTKRKSHRAGTVFLTAIMVLLSAAFSNNRKAVAGEKSMTMQASEQIERYPAKTPPIDLNTPAGFETATFGLG